MRTCEATGLTRPSGTRAVENRPGHGSGGGTTITEVNGEPAAGAAGVWTAVAGTCG